LGGLKQNVGCGNLGKKEKKKKAVGNQCIGVL